jgi:hypothetical protein
MRFCFAPTSALGDGFDSRANDIKDFLETLKPQPGQIGVIYRVDGVLAGLDLFGSKNAFTRAFAKLVRLGVAGARRLSDGR